MECDFSLLPNIINIINININYPSNHCIFYCQAFVTGPLIIVYPMDIYKIFDYFQITVTLLAVDLNFLEHCLLCNDIVTTYTVLIITSSFY